MFYEIDHIEACLYGRNDMLSKRQTISNWLFGEIPRTILAEQQLSCLVLVNKLEAGQRDWVACLNRYFLGERNVWRVCSGIRRLVCQDWGSFFFVALYSVLNMFGLATDFGDDWLMDIVGEYVTTAHTCQPLVMSIVESMGKGPISNSSSSF